MTNVIYVDLSMGQYTNIGKAVGHMYYWNKPLYSLAPNPNGYPHNGGEHTLYIKGPRDDCTTFIELLGEAYPKAAEDCKQLLALIADPANKTPYSTRRLLPNSPSILD